MMLVLRTASCPASLAGGTAHGNYPASMAGMLLTAGAASLARRGCRIMVASQQAADMEEDSRQRDATF